LEAAVGSCWFGFRLRDWLIVTFVTAGAMLVIVAAVFIFPITLWWGDR